MNKYLELDSLVHVNFVCKTLPSSERIFHSSFAKTTQSTELRRFIVMRKNHVSVSCFSTLSRIVCPPGIQGCRTIVVQ